MAPTALHRRLCTHLSSALPLLIVALLTLVLGWSALQEGRAHPLASPQASAVEASSLTPEPGHPEPLPGMAPGTESKPDSGRTPRSALPLLCQLLQWSPAASVPAPAQALLEFRPAPLRAPRGQAPPRLT